MNIRVVESNYSGRSYGYDYDLKCTCGKKETIKFDSYLGYDELFEKITSKSTGCPSCKTTRMCLPHDRVYVEINTISRTEKEYSIYTFERKPASKHHYYADISGLKKVGFIKYDLIKHELFIEKDGELIAPKNKTQSGKLLSEVLKPLGHDMDHMVRHFDIGIIKGTSSANAFGQKLYDFVTSAPLQVLENAGYGHWQNALFSKDIVKSDKTKPHQILGIPKIILSEIKDWHLGKSEIQTFQKLATKFDAQDIKAGMDIAKNEDVSLQYMESQHSLFKLALEEQCISFQKLSRYLFIEAKHRQGIVEGDEALMLISDAIKMAKEMEVDFELMPKSLKVQHDVLMMNYNVVRSEIDKGKFMEVVSKKGYKELTFESDDFVIITPESGDDLVREGRILTHCVGSYFSRVMSGTSKILFMRNKKDVKSPLVTVEVCGKNIHQARGKSNRSISSKERDFIGKWAKEKQLSFY